MDDARIQRVNGDTVMEVTVSQPVKTRISEKALLRKKTYLEQAIGKFQTELARTNAQLSQLYEEAAK